MLRLESPALKAKLEQNFEPSQAHVALEELQVEETSGLGFGVTLLLLLSLIVVSKYAQAKPTHPRPTPDFLRWPIMLSAWFSLAVFMAKSGLSSEARSPRLTTASSFRSCWFPATTNASSSRAGGDAVPGLFSCWLPSCSSYHHPARFGPRKPFSPGCPIPITC